MKYSMQAEIITIGDEILIGQTIDTNSAWLGSELSQVGVDVYMVKSIRDTSEAIVDALNSLHPGTKLVFITGGLGPTKDDLTKHTLLSYFGGELTYREEVYRHIEELFAKFDRVPNSLNKEQAMLPTSCIPIVNTYGTAPGMRFEKDEVHFVSMPGVPYEMKAMMTSVVMPWITETFLNQPIAHKTILTHGVAESELAQSLSQWESNLPEPLKLAYLPSAGAVKLRLSARTGEYLQNLKMIDEAFNRAKILLGDCVYGEDAQSMEEVVGKLLVLHGATLTTAESCTGGAIASRITSLAGSSAYYLGSVVSYANEVKIQQLGVNEADLLVHGAVSEVVVKQMAKGVQKRLHSTYSIATSGIAGPDGGSVEKPVGTIWIAVAGPNGVKAEKFQFGTNRARNIKKSVLMGLDMLRRMILADQKH